MFRRQTVLAPLFHKKCSHLARLDVKSHADDGMWILLLLLLLGWIEKDSYEGVLNGAEI